MGRSPYFLKQDDVESIDIDNELDFRIAEFVFNIRSIKA